jgi:light-regulated signal transduction histidine kinase (bacteriophytochrome)
LQEPLRMVASYLQLLERRYRGQLDESADEFINYAVDGATRMQTLINDLLNYSRVDSRGKSFVLTPCSAILDRAIANLQATIRAAHATVTCDPLPEIMADATQLTQLFQNLISNAIKFCSDQPPQIHISSQRRADAWLFSVQDNGIGIDSEYIDRIFLIFQRLHSRGEYPGTGIGLAICKKIVERHGGSIWVESQPGQGSTFYFTIPDRGGNSA